MSCPAPTSPGAQGRLRGQMWPQMSLDVQESLAVTALQKKRKNFAPACKADVAEPKRPRLGPLPGLSPYLQPLAHCFPAPEKDPSLLGIGPYVLLEPTEGGRSHRAVHRHTEAEYTCKVYPATTYREVMAPYGALPPHPNIARLAEVILGDQNVYVFFQSGRDDLHNYIRRCKRLPEPEAAALFRQMAEVVTHCHQHGVILRDLKLRRFVFADRERTRLLLENLEDSHVLSGPDDSMKDKHGCPAYVGPEILSTKGSYSGRAADIWSLGVVLYTLLAGCYPFQDTTPLSLFSKIRRGCFAVPEDLSPKARCLIRCLLRKDPAERLTAKGILLHPWLGPGGILEGSGNRPPREQRLEQLVPDVESQRKAEDTLEEEGELYS